MRLDPVRVELENAKQRERYARRQAKKKPLTDREQRKQRKKWKEQKREYRAKLKLKRDSKCSESSRQKIQARQQRARTLLKLYYEREKLKASER